MTVLLDAIYSLCSLMGWNYCYRSCRKYELSKLTQSVTYPKIIIIIALSIQRIWTLFIIVHKNVVKWEFCGFKLYRTMSCLVLLRDVIITRWRLEIWLNIVCYIQKHLSSHWYKQEKFVLLRWDKKNVIVLIYNGIKRNARFNIELRVSTNWRW